MPSSASSTTSTVYIENCWRRTAAKPSQTATERSGPEPNGSEATLGAGELTRAETRSAAARAAGRRRREPVWGESRFRARRRDRAPAAALTNTCLSGAKEGAHGGTMGSPVPLMREAREDVEGGLLLAGRREEARLPADAQVRVVAEHEPDHDRELPGPAADRVRLRQIPGLRRQRDAELAVGRGLVAVLGDPDRLAAGKLF